MVLIVSAGFSLGGTIALKMPGNLGKQEAKNRCRVWDTYVLPGLLF
jgi:hypothetical protein